MKRLAQILLIFLGGMIAINAVADEKDKKKEKPKPVPVPVYLGEGDFNGGNIKLSLFDSLIQQGLFARDSNGRAFNVRQFMFTYCERNLYEDAVGNPMIMTDYLAEYCMEGSFNEHQLDALRRRAKSGDTLIIEKILLEAADSTKAGAHGIPLKIYLVR